MPIKIKPISRGHTFSLHVINFRACYCLPGLVLPIMQTNYNRKIQNYGCYSIMTLRRLSLMCNYSNNNNSNNNNNNNDNNNTNNNYYYHPNYFYNNAC